MLLNHILRKCTGRYKLSKSQEKIYHLGRHQIVWEKWKRIGSPNTGSVDIQSRYRDRIWHRKMCYANNEKQKTTHDRRNRTTKSSKNQNALRKVTNKYWERIPSNKWRRKKNLRRTRKLQKRKYITEILSNGKTPGLFST